MRFDYPLRGKHVRALSVVLLCLTVALGACSGEGEGDARADGEDGKSKVPEAVPVEVVEARQQAVSASYTGTAPLEARTEAQVVAKTSGVALQVMVDVGDHVRAGQTLVRLDSARAALQAQQTAAQMHKLENEFQRAQKMAKEQLISAADHDKIRFDLENARAANRLARLELSYANVAAPISGVIAQRSIKPGNFVQINTPIFRIVDTSRLEATLNVPERELSTLKAGLPVKLHVDALPGKSFEGVVDRVSPVVDSGSGTFRVVAAFDSGGLLQPGMFGRIDIDYDQRANALVVPRNALLEGEGDPAVFVVRAGKAVRVPVQLGYMDGDVAEVRSGLTLGDQVVVAGKSALRDGIAVEVVGAALDKATAASVKPKAGSSAPDKQ